MLSAVIIARNEASNIARVIESVLPVADEVLVLDSGSTDGTQAIAEACGARVMDVDWLGYGATKNHGADLAAHPWILSLDADEALSEHLRTVIGRLSLDTIPKTTVFGFSRLTQFCGQWIRHGSWSRDEVWRLYHREQASWNDRPVHESLIIPESSHRQLLAGQLLHFSFPNVEHYLEKHDQYARLGAEALFADGKRASWVKLHLAPFWRGFKGYVLQGGWRDGSIGWKIAKLECRHVRDKYQRLKGLWEDA